MLILISKLANIVQRSSEGIDREKKEERRGMCEIEKIESKERDIAKLGLTRSRKGLARSRRPDLAKPQTSRCIEYEEG